MHTVSIPKKEYRELLEKKFRYEHLRRTLDEDIFAPPPIQSAKKVHDAFQQTKKYNKKFLNSLERGLQRSAHFKQ